jgi:MFS family permease
METSALQSVAQVELADRRRNAIRGAFASEFIDMFDIYLPVVVLAPVMSFFRPPEASAGAQAILASLVFITTLLGRPIGGLLFGMVADRIGRRAASVYSVSGFGVVTLLIALLPGYDTIGIAAYWLLVLLRFIDGIFLGGGYTGAMPLAMEYSKKSERGFVGGLVMAAFCAAYLSINLVALLMFALVPAEGPQSPYAQWGWRIPFVLGALLAFGLARYYVKEVPESEIWLNKAIATRAGGPIRPRSFALSGLLRGRSGRNLAQVLLMMTGFWLTQNMITLFLPTGLLSQALHLSSVQVTSTLLVTYFALFFSYIGSGVLAQRIGRRRVLSLVGVLIATAGAAILYVLANTQGLSLPAIRLLVCALAVLVTSPWGVIVTYINERFATEVRATGFGVGFSLSVIVPSFYAFYLSWLGALVPMRLAPVVLLCVGGLIGAVGAWLGPETREVDL